MSSDDISEIVGQKKFDSPIVTPQALAWDGNHLWLSSRDLGTLHKIEIGRWKIVEEIDPPGVVWAAVSLGDGEMRFTIGKGLNDDRYVYRYTPDAGFTKLFACPDFTGSYLSFDGKRLYFSQWYTGDVHEVEDSGKIRRTINVNAEICGHTFVDGMLYVIRGRENKDVPGKSEEWRLARLDPRNGARVEDIATIPFASRSLTFDGEHFWSNHRAAKETIAFSPPS
jgi:hypothetical protein